ncbi:MAG: helicase-exonuclease AddAB subunit AddA [Lachnospiraceae bacterium]|nr:helicase-exonuclease AddAB subunit AddA [Lachnospiraceae bacterium]
MSFTEQQLCAIHADIGNVLVSAAAGSGKTRVLVERIMQEIMREDNPIDIDRILIVTFTRNAASELKNRIANAIEDALAADPDNERLQLQARNVHFAKISTIDSFCQSVVRRFFHKADIDPSFRLLDDSEGALIKEHSMNEVLTAAYDEADPVFLQLVDAYGGGAGDEDLVKLIKNVAGKCESSPMPDQWLTEMLAKFETSVNSEESLFLREIVADLRKRVASVLEVVKGYADRCGEEYMPAMYEPAFRSDEASLRAILETANDTEFLRLLSAGVEWQTLSSKRGTDVDPEWKAVFLDARGRYKKTVEKLAKDAGRFSEEVFAHERDCVPLLRCLCKLVKAYRDTCFAKQKEANAYDFSAIAHIALEILIDANGVPTEEAEMMSREFEEIMIDEYQDSNMLQEKLLTAVSREINGRSNLFMVGDVKQSIYKFRQACPELFLGKCDLFAEDPSAGQRIDLQMNFRSNRAVIDSVNDVFVRLMHREVGGIDYDERAKLYYGGRFDGTAEEGTDYTSEIMLVHAEEEPVAEECTMIAHRIRELTNPETGLIVGGADHPHRATYGDIAVLVRAKEAITGTLLRTLRKAGIPVTVADAKGYYEAPEVDIVVSMLRLLDNPFQEIPMATVLTSPVFGFTADHLAMLRLAGKRTEEGRKLPYTYTVLRQIAGDASADASLRKRCEDFLAIYDSLHRHSAYLDAAELMEEFLAATKLYEYCCAIPYGETAVKNLEQLIIKARTYQTQATGNLRDFIDYVENIKKWELPVNDVSGGGVIDSVHLMTVHASKGMEFPIVFLADAGHQYNTQDFKNSMMLHEELGFGPTLFFPKERLRYGSVAADAIRRRLQRDLYGEELRLLYVAMTRAKEKLIVTGKLGKRDKLSSLLPAGFFVTGKDKVPYGEMMRDTQCFLRLTLGAVLKDCPESTVMKLFAAERGGEEAVAETAHWRFVLKNPEEPLTRPAAIAPKAGSEEYDGQFRELAEYRDFRYAERSADMPVKVSVSYLKKLAYLEKEAAEEARERGDGSATVVAESEGRFAMTTPGEADVPKPSFAKEAPSEETSSGADYGTLCHRVLQLHDYSLPVTAESCQEEWEAMAAKRQIQPADIATLPVAKFIAFFESELGERMKRAALGGRLYREKPFVMTVPAKSVRSDYPEGETILLQGVIDAYFAEDDGVVLVDYKTDRVDAVGGEEELRRRYEKQLELYADAIERGSGLHVKERIIYSFSLNKSISIGYNNGQ